MTLRVHCVSHCVKKKFSLREKKMAPLWCTRDFPYNLKCAKNSHCAKSLRNGKTSHLQMSTYIQHHYEDRVRPATAIAKDIASFLGGKRLLSGCFLTNRYL